jgi:hypothetical protein
MFKGRNAYAREIGQFVTSTGLIVLSTLALGACAQVPNQSNIQAFGQAAGSISTDFNNSISLNNDLAQSVAENKAVNYFFNGGCPSSQPNCFWGYTKTSTALSKTALQPSKDLIAAIAKYATALATASDPKTIQALQASATTLASTVGSDIAPLIGPAAPLVAPVSQLIGTAFGDAVTYEEATEIRNVMIITQPILERAAVLLKQQLATIQGNTKDQLSTWHISEVNLLSSIRDTPNVPKTAAEAEFRAALSQDQTFQTNIAAMSSYSKVLDAMVKAHSSLINPGPDTSTDLANFLALVAQLQNILSNVKH